MHKKDTRISLATPLADSSSVRFFPSRLQSTFNELSAAHEHHKIFSADLAVCWPLRLLLACLLDARAVFKPRRVYSVRKLDQTASPRFVYWCYFLHVILNSFARSGTQVFRLNIYNHLASVFTSLYQQALGLEQEINRISAENNITSEINLLCFSQGLLLLLLANRQSQVGWSAGRTLNLP